MEDERTVIVLLKPILIGNKCVRDLEITVTTRFERPPDTFFLKFNKEPKERTVTLIKRKR